MEQQQPSHPLPNQAKPQKSGGKKIGIAILSIFALFVIIAIIEAVNNTSNTIGTASTPAAPDNTNSSNSQQTQTSTKTAHTPQVLLDLSGNGTKTTQMLLHPYHQPSTV